MKSSRSTKHDEHIAREPIMRETPAQRIERLLHTGDADGALAAANQLLAQSPTSFVGRYARCRANIRLRNFIDAETDIELALALSPKDEQANLTRATLDQRLGRNDAAFERMRRLASGRGSVAQEAAFALAEGLFNAGRLTEMKEFVAHGGDWLRDPRAGLVVARVKIDEDFEDGLALFRSILRGREHPLLRRAAGFEAAGRLDKVGRYREAFEWASETHRATTQPIDMDGWLRPLGDRMQALAHAPQLFAPRVAPVEGVAIVCAMPRSGTTLLEMMLDRHPSIGGIGEFDGLTDIQHGLGKTPGWPRNLCIVPERQLANEQSRYLAGARQIRKEHASWTFDKSLLAWQILLEIAAVLPGAVLLDVARDPRDLAVSQFMSFLSAEAYAWTRNLQLIRSMIEFRSRFVPHAIASLGVDGGPLRFESFIYEDLVEDPAHYARKCLTRMGLPMNDAVLSPEKSSRGASTLSSQQVKKPINRSSIGRWRNYEWAFDDSWTSLVAAHDARRER
jgi:hypothetical protein